MKSRKMTPEEIAEYKMQKEQEYADYVPPILTEEDLQDMRDREEENYYVSDVTPEEEAAFKRSIWSCWAAFHWGRKEKRASWRISKKGIQFSKGKALGARSKSTLHIEELTKRNPNLTAKELFKLSDPGLIGKMSLATFQNHVSKIKNNQK